MKWFWLCLLLVGCGRETPLGPSLNKEEKVLSITVINRSGYQVPTDTMKRFVRWRQGQVGGLGGKTIMIYVHKQTSNVLGNAYLGGEEIWLYVRPQYTISEILQTLAHETDHLRGFRHDYTDRQDYAKIVKDFGA